MKSHYRLVVIAFACMILLGTTALMLPFAVTGNPTWPGDTYNVAQSGLRFGSGAPFSTALFTATSASCVTGLVVVDTATYWTTFGQGVILALIEIGGLGTMALASVIAVVLTRKLTINRRVGLAQMFGAVTFDDVAGIVRRSLKISALTQVLAALIMAVRLMVSYGMSPGEAAWQGFFLAGSAYNNAGFAMFTDSLIGFASDPWILLPISACIIIGGLGLPVLREILREGLHFRRWTLNTRTVITGTAILIIGGWIFYCVLEWNRSLGDLDTGGKILSAFFSSVTARTAGFNSVDYSQMHPTSWFGTDILMLIGAGPAGTAGGLKVTTIAAVVAIAWAEMRGEKNVIMFGKQLQPGIARQVITVTGLSFVLILVVTMCVTSATEDRFTLDHCLFEVISAFATVGLTTGITPTLPVWIQYLLSLVMFVGRIGPVLLASSLVLRIRSRAYELPTERILIG